jgi:hypothetical protein
MRPRWRLLDLLAEESKKAQGTGGIELARESFRSRSHGQEPLT